MIPRFEIFASIARGNLMPWLEENRQSQRFHLLLQLAGPSPCSSPEKFFSLLNAIQFFPGSSMQEGLAGEVNILSVTDIRCCSSLAAAFGRFPAHSCCQQFYNQLTGISAAGYMVWAGNLMESVYATQFRHIMTSRLATLISHPAYGGEASAAELEVVYLSKAALCLLYDHLARPASLYLPAREMLRQQLDSGNPDSGFKGRVIGLYDSLSATAPEVQAAGKSPAKVADVEAMPPLEELLAGWKSDFYELKEMLQQFVRLPVVREPEPNRWIDAATVRSMLGISKSSMHRYRQNGLLPYLRIGDKYNYREADVLRILRMGLRRPPSDQEPKQ